MKIENLTGEQSHVPREIIILPGVATLLTQDTTSLNSEGDGEATSSQASALVSDIISLAGTHRTQASDTRLHAGRPRTVQTTSSSNKFNNLSRAQQVNLERQQKKAEAKLREENKGITMIAALWQYDKKSKLIEVSL